MRSERPNVSFLFLTLTAPNVPASELGESITSFLKAWTRLQQRKEVKSAVLGWFRSLEITYNDKDDEYHPHIHALLAVPAMYFKGRHYIKQSRWLELWQEAMRDDSITQVNIKKIKPNPNKTHSTAIEASAAETAKYATKPSDYLTKCSTGNYDEYYYKADKKIVLDLAKAIKGRRLQQVGGEFKRIKAELELEDIESDDVDLIHVNKDDPLIEVIRHEMYRWNPNLRNYIN
jgi:plasmid rolling circle replication initiator protein Rep